MDIKINYRLPQEFIYSTWKLRRAIRIWIIYVWYENYGYYWLDKEWGFRFLGIEIVILTERKIK